MLVPPASSSAVLVMIRSKSVSICNHSPPLPLLNPASAPASRVRALASRCHCQCLLLKLGAENEVTGHDRYVNAHAHCVSHFSLSAGGMMMAEVVAVDDGQRICSESSSAEQHSAEFRDPLGVNDHLRAAVDDESDEFDFDVSLSFAAPLCCFSCK